LQRTSFFWATSVLTDSVLDNQPLLQHLIAGAAAPARIRFTLYAALEAVYQSANMRDGVDYLIGSLGPRGQVRLLLYFAAPPPSWRPAALWLADLAERYPGPVGRFVLEGPFRPIPESDMLLLHQAGCQLSVVAGWPAGPEGWRPDVLRDLARFGFRAPLICYVDAGNIEVVPSWIEEACEASEHSGFSLPLVFQHPAYTFAPSQPPGPDAEAYAALLVKAYHDYSHYDDVFQPVAELTDAVAHGGWCRVRNAPADIRLALNQDGAGVFRQIPAQARPWAEWNRILTADPALLGPSLVKTAATLFAWEGNAFCRSCAWRFVCGGIDGWPGRTELPSDTLRAGCEYRKLFLPELLFEKGQRTAEVLAFL
jgi:hypothetical protein